MTEAEATLSDETRRIYYELRKHADSFSEIRSNHIRNVYKENKFLHGEVPPRLDESIEFSIRIVLLQVNGILNTTNLPHHFCLRLIRSLIEMSIEEIDSAKEPSIAKKDQKVLWNEFRAILDS